MKRKFTFLIAAAFMLLTMMATTGEMWGQTATYSLTPDQSSTGSTATSYITTLTEFTYNNVSWKMNQWNPKTLQIKTNQSSATSEFRFYNTGAIPGRITQVVITFSALTVDDASKLMFKGGSSEVTATSGGTAGTWNSTAKTLTWTPGANDNFTYFAFYQNGKAASGTNYLASSDAIVVTYIPSCAIPTFTPNGGLFVGSQEISLACTTTNATIYYTTDGSTPTTSSSVYTEPFTINETTTIKAFGVKDGLANSGVATATFTKVEPLTSMEAVYNKAIEVGSTSTAVIIDFDNWVITGTNGNSPSQAWVTDGTGFGAVIYKPSTSALGFVSGNTLSGRVQCNVKKYTSTSNPSYSYVQLDNLTSSTPGLTTGTGGSVDPIAKSIDELSTQHAGVVVSINNLTYNGTYLADASDNRILLSTYLYSATLVSGKTYDITGVISYAYPSSSIAIRINPRSSADVVESVTPTITVSPASVNVEAAGGDKHFNATYTAIETNTGLDILWYESDGTTPATYDWVDADFDNDNNIDAVVDANTGEARTAYFKVYGLDSQANDVYSNLVTISQVEYVELFTVNFELGGGTFVPNSDFDEAIVEKPAGTYNLPSATRPGYSFDGWNDGTTTYEADDEYTVSDDVTFTAQWTEMTTGTINFGNANGSTQINATSKTGYDSMSYTWTITTVGTTSFSQSTYYSQVGSKNNPATSITFTTTLASSVTITSFSAKFGGFADTAGDIVLKVGETTVGSGSLNATNDVIVTNTSIAAGDVLTITVTNIAKGVKCYYITYTINTSTDPLISLNPTSLTGFTYTEGNGPSETQTFSVAGAFLEDDITVALPVSSNYEIKLAEGNWTNSLTLEQSNGTVSATTINVRMKAGLSENNYNESITLTSGEVSETVTLSGVVTPAPVMTTYNLVTSVTNGKHYIIVAEKNEEYYALGSQNGDYRNSVDITVTSNSTTISNYDGVTEIVINGNTTDDYTLHADGFLNGGNKILKNIGSAGSKWDITFDGDNHAIIDYGSDYTIQFNSDRFNCYNSAQTKVYLYEKEDDIDLEFYGNVNYTATSIPTGETLTITPGSVMTVTSNEFSNNDPKNLVIQDGGQLVHASTVKATIKKSVDASSSWGEKGDPVDGWYTIASPVAGASVSAVTSGNYDLYKYEENNANWYNYHAHTATFTTFEQGIGYLYANAADKVISYGGDMIGTDTEISMELSYAGTTEKKGANLMGNPFSRNIKTGELKINSTNVTTYYVLEGGAEFVAQTLASTPIKPGQGFFVQATAEGQNLIFNPAPASKDREIEQTGYISIKAGNSEFTDNAFIQIANGNTLRKMTLSDNSSIVYVMNGGKDYAAARIDALEGSMPVCFKANKLGSYTITIEAKDIKTDYLHLIDNFTHEDIDLLLEPSYSFIASNGDNASRFTLVFRAEGSAGITNDIFAYQNGSDIVVNGEGELQVFDVMGRLIATQHINGVQTVNVNANGVYIFKLNEKTQKIVVR